jgi:regulator of CtrA degradation
MISNGEPLATGSETTPIAFARHLAGSQVFRALFQDGMDLVDETAAYLDGPGRTDSQALNRVGSLAYATESMRLTTRLMQLASWLLLQRAVNSGEITPEQAATEKAKVKLGGLASATRGPGWDDLPERLRDLVDRSTRLQARIRRLDDALGSEQVLPPAPDNPVLRQLGRIAEAFGAS